MGDNHAYRSPKPSQNDVAITSHHNSNSNPTNSISLNTGTTPPYTAARSLGRTAELRNAEVLHAQSVHNSPVFALQNSPHLARGAVISPSNPDRQFLEGYQRLKQEQERIKQEMRDRMRGARAATTSTATARTARGPGLLLASANTPMSRIAASSTFWDQQRKGIQVGRHATPSPAAAASRHRFFASGGSDKDDGFWSGESYDDTDDEIEGNGYGDGDGAVSYTHLTLPTIYSV